ncbi:MAG: response regulator transcription factor [Xanthomonadales bacterium]|nr:response regulator transcription factor [Xanthomonadales bacterium]
MSRKPSILIIEDEVAIRDGLVDVFVFHGYDVTAVGDGNEGLELARRGTFDLVLLDLMLPGVNGFEICEQVREVDRDQPIIMLTARTADEDIIRGLKLGADDYVSKPFSVAELVLRVEAVLRRSPTGAADRMIRLSDQVEIDTANLAGRHGKNELVFTRREMEVVEYLASNSDRAVSREELLSRVWGYARDAQIETRTVDIHIAKLRRKLEDDPKNPRFLITVRGAGYRLLTA